MAYIGKEPVVGNFQVCDAITVVNGQAAYSLTVGSAAVNPESANHMLVSLNGILQKPGSSFTISGSTITFASNLVTNDVIDFVQILGNVLDLGQPSDDTVKTASLQANAVTGAKLNTDTISAQTALAAEPADTDEFLVSDAGVLKRIDYSLIKGGGAFNLLSTSTISSGTAAVNITSNIDSTFKNYLVTITNLHAASDGAVPRIRFFSAQGSPDTGSRYVYSAVGWRSNSAQRSHDTSGNDHGSLGNQEQGAANDEAFNAKIYLNDPASTTFQTVADFTADYINSSGQTITMSGMTKYNSGDGSNPVTGISIFMSSGNIDSGIFKLYGIT